MASSTLLLAPSLSTGARRWKDTLTTLTWKLTAISSTTTTAPLFLSRRAQEKQACRSLLPTAFFSLPAPAPAATPSFSLGSLLRDFLLDPLLRAVPKKKVSHSRKSMRSANKGLKDRVDIVHCPGCGRAKLHHHLCPHCYGDIDRRQKAELRNPLGSGSAEGSGLPSLS
ncbi:hypothetical protein OC846_001192 [Tilletia horrida]|uniref:Large ribosomal subunit protein bL32m n=1 Tax=Tilletia horrida TaxID=155126 RepID=A0AAN6GVP3_9BASI|nr:hypothetical protein OC846_001192 [Tilletia horrida]KAK0569268.1 hypothetical protein OC861_001083 [Tilletia horrida]